MLSAIRAPSIDKWLEVIKVYSHLNANQRVDYYSYKKCRLSPNRETYTN